MRFFTMALALACFAAHSFAAPRAVDISKAALEKANPGLSNAKFSSEKSGGKRVDVVSLDGGAVAVPVDISQFWGKSVAVSAMFSIKEIVPQDPNGGVRLILSFVGADGKRQYASSHPFHGSDMKLKVSTNKIDIPESAKDARIVVKYTDAGGACSFKKLKISEVEGEGFWKPDLPKNFKCQYTGDFLKLPRIRGVTVRPSIAEADIAEFAKWGGNTIRTGLGGAPADRRFDFDLTYEAQILSPDYFDRYEQWFSERLERAKKLVEICRRHGVSVVLVFGSTPGFRYMNKDMRIFYEKRYADKFVDCWKRIAKTFKGNPAIRCYDLCNEPIQTRPAGFDSLKLHFRTAKAIREIDPNVPISIESRSWDNPEGFKDFAPLPLKNIIYQAHMYIPHKLTHYNVAGRGEENPAPEYPSELSNPAQIREALKPVAEFAQKWGAQIYIGEFSCARWVKGREDYIADCISYFEEMGWHWTYHAFRESHIWSVEHGSDKNNIKPAPSRAKDILKNGLLKNIKK